MSDKEYPRVLSHEVGHAIDDLAGEIPRNGLSRELSQVYSDLNNPFAGQGSRPRGFGPEALGYSKNDAPHEMMAEAIRAYMVDPNHIKSVAPKTAARIRKYVNENLRIAKAIQFNSIAAALAAGGSAYAPSGTSHGRAPGEDGGGL
ncbi:hypothetical protein [Pikeienuella sp. HZG-20]|uniref:hypothetical protein n=1 Tax=Paludibacillus litoralis TaxID=3133267 RepID=UPI0030EBFAA3